MIHSHLIPLFTRSFPVNIDDAEAVTNRVTFNTQMKPVDDKNLLIIEAIPELMEAKQKLFKDLWSVLLLFTFDSNFPIHSFPVNNSNQMIL